MSNTANELTNISPENQQKFVALASQLSPENLSCDGELSYKQIRAKKSQLDREWARLEKEVGCRVSEEQVWGWSGW